MEDLSAEELQLIKRSTIFAVAADAGSDCACGFNLDFFAVRSQENAMQVL